MTNDNNPDFFSYSGTIDRKNYIINMLIVTVLFILCNFIDTDALTGYSDIAFLKTILTYMILMFQFILVFSALSLVYRRFSDIFELKSQNTQDLSKKIFVFIFVLPLLYLFVLRNFFDIIPGFVTAGDILFFFLFVPVMLITSLVIAFIKK